MKILTLWLHYRNFQPKNIIKLDKFHISKHPECTTLSYNGSEIETNEIVWHQINIWAAGRGHWIFYQVQFVHSLKRTRYEIESIEKLFINFDFSWIMMSTVLIYKNVSILVLHFSSFNNRFLYFFTFIDTFLFILLMQVLQSMRNW